MKIVVVSYATTFIDIYVVGFKEMGFEFHLDELPQL